MNTLLTNLCEVYDMERPTLSMENIDGSYSGDSESDVEENMIVMRGKLSIITFLNNFCFLMLSQHPMTKFLFEDLDINPNMVVRGFIKGWASKVFFTVYPEQREKLTRVGFAYVDRDDAHPDYFYGRGEPNGNEQVEEVALQ